jgi:hypothetical protein
MVHFALDTVAGTAEAKRKRAPWPPHRLAVAGTATAVAPARAIRGRAGRG